MSNQRPIVPSPEQVDQWFNDAVGSASLLNSTPKYCIATQAAQWGADQELEACVNWLIENQNPRWALALRIARRPKPPSLKEQALSELNLTADPDGAELSRTQVELIRKALESL